MTNITTRSGLGTVGYFANAAIRFSGSSAAAKSAPVGNIGGAKPADVQSAAERAASAFADALRQLSVTSKPSYTTRYVRGTDLPASIVRDVSSPAYRGISSTLRTTERVNAQTDTSRVSSSAIGLDLSPGAVSVLKSKQLGLDITSPSRASVLSSSNGLGLDITSAERASVLTSSARLNLDVTSAERSSQIQSTGEMNASPTWLSSYDVNITGGIRAQLSSTYSGTSTTLRVRLNGLTSIGTSATSINADLLNTAGQVVGNYTGNVVAGQAVTFGSSGVQVRFSSGFALFGGTSDASTVTQSPTTVNASAAFNSAWGTAPTFENFQVVSAGSFTINGTTVSVAANDTINSVVARINASVSGITAIVSADKVILTTNSASEDSIMLAGDTSGFLAATKLSSATTAAGNIRDDRQVLSKTSQFGSVTSGSFKINDASITVNKDTDTFNSIVSRINTAGAGVTAAYDSAQDRLVLTTTSNTEDQINVSSDTTGFLTAAKLATTNTVRGNLRDDQQVLAKTSQFSSVASGAFQLNGVSIAVNRDTDTLTTLVARINSSSAGVTAAFDSTANKLVLTGTANSEDDITVTNDTSGFLTAANWATANTVRGNLPDNQQALAKTSQFGSVISGSFTINGVSIAVNRSTDTLTTLISRINSASAGVTASYDTTNDRVVLAGQSASEDDIAVANDNTGFLTAAGLTSSNTVHGNIPDDQQFLGKTTQFASVATGSFKVNGVSIAVNRGTDTFSSVVARINQAGAGVTASYDSASDRLSITPSVSGATLTLTDDASGFLAAARQSTGAWGTHVNASAAFNGTGATSALLDPTKSVHAGSFTVNGVSINVAASDSLNSVISKINTSRAGVQASFDNSTQTLSLATRNGSDSAIAIGSDTSGFLSATKLDHALTTTVGEKGSSAVDTVLSKLPAFSHVSAGAMTINGVNLSVNPATTTIRDFVTRLNALNGVSASIDGSSVKISADSVADSLSVTKDTSGLWAALGGTLGSVAGVAGPHRLMKIATGQEITSNSSKVTPALARAIDTLNLALDLTNPDDGETGARRSRLQTSLNTAISALSSRGIEGLSLTNHDGKLKIAVDSDKLTASLTQSADSIGAGIETIANTLRSSFVSIGKNIADFVAASAVNVPADRSQDNLLADQIKAKFLTTRLRNA
jgi:hypothetical protein